MTSDQRNNYISRSLNREIQAPEKSTYLPRNIHCRCDRDKIRYNAAHQGRRLRNLVNERRKLPLVLVNRTEEPRPERRKDTPPSRSPHASHAARSGKSYPNRTVLSYPRYVDGATGRGGRSARLRRSNPTLRRGCSLCRRARSTSFVAPLAARRPRRSLAALAPFFAASPLASLLSP